MTRGAERASLSGVERRRAPGAGAVRFFPLLFAGFLSALFGCKRLAGSAAADGGARVDPAKSPLSQDELSTDDPRVALPNLESAVAGAERTIEQMPNARTLSQAAEVHLVRAQYLGRVSDYDRALELGERAVHDFPTESDAHLGRARARAALHRFSDALHDLEAAERLGASRAYLDEARAAILQGTGHPEEALRLFRSIEPRSTDLSALGAEAALLGELGELAKAEKLFTLAQHKLRGVSPFPLAWLYYQQGLMWERAGNAERARILFEAAIARIPTYAPAISHLAAIFAATNRRDEAIRLLQPLAESEDPEHAGALAGLFVLKGQKEEAERLRAQAGARYDALMAKHPEAYASHAARFWLGAGDDPKKALSAAKKELANRRTSDAFDLALTAAIASHDAKETCRLAEEAAAEQDVGRNILALVRVAFDACGNGQRKAEIEARLSGGRQSADRIP